MSDKEDRTRNVIIYGLEESYEESIEEEVANVLKQIEEKPVIKDCCRVGTRKSDSKRPIKFTLRSSNMVEFDGRCPSFDSSPLSLRATSTAENFREQFGAREVCRASQKYGQSDPEES